VFSPLVALAAAMLLSWGTTSGDQGNCVGVPLLMDLGERAGHLTK
jgi:hypothetical protein